MGKAGISIPAKELIAVPLSGRGAQMPAVINTEGKRLVIRAPGQVGTVVFRQTCVQEGTVLDLPPLRINRYTVNRHGGMLKIVFTVAGSVHVPAFENVAFFTGGEVRRNVVIREACPIVNFVTR